MPPVKVTPKKFGSWLKTARQRRRVSQQELGDRAGVHKQVISRIERQVHMPRATTMQKLAKGLGLPVLLEL